MMDETSNAQPPVGVDGTEPAAGGVDCEALKGQVVDAMCTVYDPEIPVNIYELGLIYTVEVTPAADVHVVMTLTSPMCPVAEILPGEVEMSIRGVDGVNEVEVELTWDPPWTPELMSEAAKLKLGFM